MEDPFWRDNRKNEFDRRSDPFWDPISLDPFRSYESPFSLIHDSMQQMHREMNNMMRYAFGNINPYNPYNPYNLPERRQQQAIESQNKDQDLDKQVQQYGIESIFNDDKNYLSDWDFVKQLEQIEKEPKSIFSTNDNDGKIKFYGRSHFYNYSNTGDGRVEERKVVQDSKGNRMESVQRRLGDRIWARTTKQNDRGEVDEDEKMYNMEDQDKDKFMNDWRSTNRFHQLPYATVKNEYDKFKTIDIPIDQTTQQNQTTDNTLPSLVNKNESNGWLDKLKFWKKN